MTNIILDTNAARELVQGIQLAELEKYAQMMEQAFSNKNMKLLVSPIVVMELLCHLEVPSDRDFKVCFKAIKVMMLLQETWQRDKGAHYMLPPSELLIIHEIYHMHSEEREKMYSQMMGIATKISHGDIKQIPDLHTTDGSTLKHYVDEVEKSFAKQIQDLCRQTELISESTGMEFEEGLNNPDVENLIISYFSRTSYNLLLAEGKVPNYYKFLPPFAPATLENYEKFKHFLNFNMKSNLEIKRRYPAFLALTKEVVRRIHISHFKISEDRLCNYVWDILLMFHINDHTIKSEPCIFVTSDKAMLLSSGAFHDRHKVMNYGEFQELLNVVRM